MPRLPRSRQKSICYHVYNRGINRQPIFGDDIDRRQFTNTVIEYKTVFHAQVYHWAWMHNHYHLLVEVAFDYLRPFAGGIQQSYAQYHHARHGSCGTFWQGRFQSKPVETGSYLERCGRYIERNAVRGGQVGRAWEYPWSSAAAYVLGAADGLSDHDPYLVAQEWTAGDRARYAEALRGPEDDRWMEQYSTCRVIGSVQFARRLRPDRGRYHHKRGGGRPDRNAIQTTGSQEVTKDVPGG